MSHRPRRPLSEEERFRLRIQQHVRALAEPWGLAALSGHQERAQETGARCEGDDGAQCVTTLDHRIEDEAKRRARVDCWFDAMRIDPALMLPSTAAAPMQRGEKDQALLDWLETMRNPPEEPDDPLGPLRVDMFGNRLPPPMIDERNLLWPGLWRTRHPHTPAFEPEPPFEAEAEPAPAPEPARDAQDTPLAPRSQRAITLMQSGALEEALRVLDGQMLTPGELLLRSDIEAELGRRAEAHRSAVRAVAAEVEVPGGIERADRPVFDAAPPLPAFVAVRRRSATWLVWFGAHVVLGRGGDFGLASPLVSREHLGVSLDEGAIVVRDLRSTHGTEIETDDGTRRPLSRHVLEDRAVLWLGKEVRVALRRIDATTVDLELPAETVTLALGCTFLADTITLTYARGRYHFQSPTPLRQHGESSLQGVLAAPYTLRADADGPVVLAVDRARVRG